MEHRHMAVMSFAVLAAGLLVAVPDAPAATATAKCQAMKVKAAGKKVFDKAKCQDKALRNSTSIDPACLQKAEDKFMKAIARADSIGTCSGTVTGIEADVDACLADLVDNILIATSTTTPTSSTTTTTESQEPLRCCAFLSSGVCSWAGSTTCIQGGGTPGAAGSVCNPQNGECTPEIQGAGNCCTVTTAFAYGCTAGPDMSSSNCAGLGGTFSTGVCSVPGPCVP